MPRRHAVLRLARTEDAPILRYMIRESARYLCTGDYSDEQIEGAKTDFGFATLDEQLIEDKTYFVAETGGAIVGCGGWAYRCHSLPIRGETHGERIELPHPSRNAAAIRGIFVHPGWSGQGIGRRLVRAAEAAARLQGFDAFEIAATFTGVPLYRKLGYHSAATYHMPLGEYDSFPFVLMTKTDGQPALRN